MARVYDLEDKIIKNTAEGEIMLSPAFGPVRRRKDAPENVNHPNISYNNRNTGKSTEKKTYTKKSRPTGRKTKIIRKKRRRRIAVVIGLIIAAALVSRLSIVQNLTSKAGIGLLSESRLREEGYPESLIKLYEKNPEARQFVLDYKDHTQDNSPIDISSDVKSGEIPLFLQWDERWGYKKYGDDFLAITGCGPTSLSMVYVGLTGDTDMNPYEMAKKAQNDGYYVSGSGSSWSMMTGLAEELGLSASELGMDESTVKSKLRDGHPIICIMGPGDFTTTGHFIVLTGVSDDGEIEVNDPNSKENSEKNWKFSKISSQIRDMWVYSK